MVRDRYFHMFVIRAVPDHGHHDAVDVLNGPIGGASLKTPSEVEAAAEVQRAPGVDGATPMTAPRVETPEADEPSDTER